MKVACLQENLQRALAQVSRAIATKTSLPVLSNVLLSTNDGQLKIVATNFEFWITTRIPASIEEEGQVTVDARLLSEFVGTLPNETVSLATDATGTRLSVQCARDKAQINGIDAEDFPVVPTVADDAFAAVVDPQLLREMIAQVELAAATDDSRPVLAGVLTRLDGDRITLASADGFRMAVRDGVLLETVDNNLDVIVPARAMREMARIIGDSTDPLRIAITPNQGQLLARVGETEFISRLIEGTFPDVKQIVPKEFSTKVEVERDHFLSAVRRASFFARDNNDVIRLAIRPAESDGEPGIVEISATAAERGNSESFVDSVVTGPDLQVAFNARYLTDVLGVIKHHQIMVGMNGANQAGVLRSADSDDYTHVIMPMVIGSN